MRMTPKEILRAIMATGLNQTEVAELVGVSQSQVNRWLKGADPRGSNREKLITYAVKLGVVPSIQTIQSARVPIRGVVESGEITMSDPASIDEEELSYVELRFPVPPDVIAFTVRGNSMFPRYRDGDVILTRQERRKSIDDDVIGTEAIVGLPDGKCYLKVIREGSRKGVFTLESWNAPPMYDASPEWISEVYLIIPSGSAGR